MRGIIDVNASIVCEVGEEIEIDGVMYVGVVSSTQEVMGVQGKMVLRNAKKQGIHVIQGKQKNAYSIQLVPKDFIASLLNTCEVGEERTIDGIIYLGVTVESVVL